jgi:hypothetical protein
MTATPHAAPFCAIDFGTSNSAIAVSAQAGRMALVDVENGERTMPTAVFYQVEGRAAHQPPLRLYGRAALAAYVEGHEGRLMRSMKSVLGSTLADQQTEVGAGHAVRYLDVVSGYLQHLKALAERATGAPIARAVVGRPVYFVDDDPVRDAQAQRALEARRAPSASPRSASSSSRSPPRSTTSWASPTSSWCWWPTSAAAPRTSRWCGWGRSGARAWTAPTTSWPTTASTSPAPTSTARSNSPPSCRPAATAAWARCFPASRRARCRAGSISTSRPGT